MRKELMIVGVAVVLTVVFMWEFMPRRTVEKIVPNIVTQYDTVTVNKLPDWYVDSVKKWKKRIHTTDTVNLYVTNTIVRSDTITQFVYVGPDTSRRQAIWPIIAYFGGSHFGDTAVVSSFNLKTGDGAIARVFIPGILTALVADSTSSIPKMSFAPFPKPRKTSLFYKVKLIGAGYGSCLLINSVR